MVFYFTVHDTNNEIQTVSLIRSEKFNYFCFMPINKNAYRRYKVIDSCLRNKMRTYPKMNDLLAAIEEKLDVNTTAETVQKDIATMKMLPPDGFDAPIKFNPSIYDNKSNAMIKTIDLNEEYTRIDFKYRSSRSLTLAHFFMIFC